MRAPETSSESPGEGIVAELAKIQQAMPSRGFHAGYVSAFPEELFDRVDAAAEGLGALLHTAIRLWPAAGCASALRKPRSARRPRELADWVKFRVDRLSDDSSSGLWIRNSAA